jgi:hypothetical protein
MLHEHDDDNDDDDDDDKNINITLKIHNLQNKTEAYETYNHTKERPVLLRY